MTSTILKWVLIGLLLLATSVLHAEGGCPPGFQPSGVAPNSQDPVGCRPIPGYDQQSTQGQSRLPPRTLWIDHWGAIATALPKGILGTSTDLLSQDRAEQAALADCQSKGGATCKIELSYRNQCVAMIVGHPGYNVTPSATLAKAIQKGMNTCSDAGDTNCHVYYTACSLPMGIQ